MDRIKINSHCCQRIESNIFALFNILLQFNKEVILLLYWVKIFTPPMHLFAFISLPLSKPDPHSEQSLCSPASSCYVTMCFYPQSHFSQFSLTARPQLCQKSLGIVTNVSMQLKAVHTTHVTDTTNKCNNYLMRRTHIILHGQHPM